MSQLVLFDAPGPKARRNYAIFGTIGVILSLVIAAAIVYGLRNELLDPDYWAPIVDPDTWLYYFLPGLQATLTAAGISLVTAGVLGFLLAMGRMTHIKVVSWISTVFIEFFRAVPVLMMMLFAYAVLNYNQIVPSQILALTAVVSGLTFYNAAVIAELIRSGVRSLPSGQREAGLAIGLTRTQTQTSILVPQAITAMLPALVSQLVVVLKDTALGYIVTYPELVRAAQTLDAVQGNLIVSFVVVAVIFIVINFGLTSFAHWVERKMRTRTAGGTLRLRQATAPEEN